MDNLPGNDVSQYHRYYLSYSGATLPLNLVSPIEPDETKNRNTYFGALIDDQGRTILIHKRVYGEIELSHRYAYDGDGNLRRAEILGIEDGRQLVFDPSGNVVEDIEIDIED